jgi:hypothetical protein
MIKKKTRYRASLPGLAAVLAALISAACLQPANEVPTLEYVPPGLRDSSANFSAAPGSDMIIASFEGGAFQSGVSAADFTLRMQNGAAVTVDTAVVDSETQAVLPFETPLGSGDYRLTIRADAFSRNPGRLTVKAVKGDGAWSAPPDTGFNRSPIYALSYGSGKYLAGGGGGNLFYSRDGSAWTNIPPGSSVIQSKFTQDILGIAYGNGTFYAVGKGAQVAYSADGQNWTGYTESIFDNSLSISTILYGGGKFLAAGDRGRMMFMNDDGGWTRVAENHFGDSHIRALAWGRVGLENRYVAGGDGAGETAGNGKLCWSEDGVSWVYSASFGVDNKRVNGLAFGGGYFVAVLDNGKIFRSDDGATWTEKHALPGGTGLLSVVYGSGIFIAAGHNGVALVSEDQGDTWEPITVPYATGHQISCAAYSAGCFILAGHPYAESEGQFVSGGRLAAAYFKPALSSLPAVPEDLVSAPFELAAEDNRITITLAGGAFKEIPAAADFDLSNAGFSGGTVLRDRQTPRVVVFTGITVTAPGDGKTITIKAGALAAKAPSATVSAEKQFAWTIAPDTKFGASNIRGMAYGNDTYVAVGAGKIARSSDGLNWTEVPSPAGGDNHWVEEGNYVDFQGIAYGNGRFVAVGYWLHGDNGNGWGVAVVSPDGTTWTRKEKILTNGADSAHVYAVTWTGANFVAVGRWGRSAVSPDGETWTGGQIDGFNWLDNPSWWEDAYAVAADGTGKVVAGGAKGKLAYSADHGSTWTWAADDFFGAEKAIRAIALSNNIFFAAGDGGNMKTASSASSYNWQGVDSKFGEAGILALAAGGGRIIAVGHNGKISVSTDGSGWAALEAGPGQSGFTGDEQIACAVYGGGKFVIGGNAYNDKGNLSKIAHSNQ